MYLKAAKKESPKIQPGRKWKTTDEEWKRIYAKVVKNGGVYHITKSIEGRLFLTSNLRPIDENVPQ